MLPREIRFGMMVSTTMADDGSPLDARAAARRIGIAAATVRWHAVRGALVGHKQGRLWVFEAAEVERFAAAERKPGQYPGPRGPHRRPKQLSLPPAEVRPRRELATQEPLFTS